MADTGGLGRDERSRRAFVAVDDGGSSFRAETRYKSLFSRGLELGLPPAVTGVTMNLTPSFVALASVRRALAGSFAAAVLVLGLAHCSGSSNAGGSTGSACQTVCSCVSSHGGDSAQCMTECNSVAASSHDPKNDCESALKSRGFSSCEDSCNAFSSTSSTSGGGGGTATLADFCEKCASCVGESGFEEGFCKPFKTSGGGFDVASCTTSGRVSDLSNPTLAKATLSSLSCEGFDDAE